MFQAFSRSVPFSRFDGLSLPPTPAPARGGLSLAGAAPDAALPLGVRGGMRPADDGQGSGDVAPPGPCVACSSVVKEQNTGPDLWHRVLDLPLLYVSLIRWQLHSLGVPRDRRGSGRERSEWWRRLVCETEPGGGSARCYPPRFWGPCIRAGARRRPLSNLSPLQPSAHDRTVRSRPTGERLPESALRADRKKERSARFRPLSPVGIGELYPPIL